MGALHVMGEGDRFVLSTSERWLGRAGSEEQTADGQRKSTQSWSSCGVAARWEHHFSRLCDGPVRDRGHQARAEVSATTLKGLGLMGFGVLLPSPPPPLLSSPPSLLLSTSPPASASELCGDRLRVLRRDGAHVCTRVHPRGLAET